VLMRLRDEEAESLDDGGPEAATGTLRVEADGVGPVEVAGVGPLLPLALDAAWLCVDGALDDAPCPAAERCDTAADDDECVETASSSLPSTNREPGTTGVNTMSSKRESDVVVAAGGTAVRVGADVGADAVGDTEVGPLGTVATEAATAEEAETEAVAEAVGEVAAAGLAAAEPAAAGVRKGTAGGTETMGGLTGCGGGLSNKKAGGCGAYNGAA
jgi:hypothetical protein